MRSPPFAAPSPSLKVGVPQDSILSPTLFNLYMSLLAHLAEAHGAKIISYADDTQLLFTCDKKSDLRGEVINACLSDVFAWFQLHQLKCNPDKSEIILFGLPGDNMWRNWWPQDRSPPSALVKTVKNLGVRMEDNLSMKAQVQVVVGSCFGVLKMLRQFLPLMMESHSKTVVQALVLSRLDYVNSLYLGIPEYLLTRLQVVQNAAARAIIRLKPRTRMSTHLKAMHWLPIRKRIIFKSMVLAFKSLHGIEASYLRKRVQFYCPCHALRSAALQLACSPKYS